jgi:DNA-binding response OmpR family regulator
MLLERRNLDPSCAHTLAEGIACSQAEEYGCVVLDLGLPDTKDFYETINAIPRFAPAPVIVMTGSEDKPIMRECMRLGAEFVLKGDDSLGLMTRILQAIERRFPSDSIENEIIDVEHKKQTTRGGKELPIVPLLSFSLALIIASCTGGAFLYRSISNQAARDQALDAHLVIIDDALKDYKTRILLLDSARTDMSGQLQLDAQDRAGIRREVATGIQQQLDYRNDVLRRLERIEDHQLALLKGGK